MNSTKKAARLAGLLYLGSSIPGFFGLMYVPSTLIVSGGPAATVRNIAASETLFRSGIITNVLGQSAFVFVAFALYQLFKGVDKVMAAVMVTLIVVSIPIALLNELNHTAVLTLATAAGSSAAFAPAQRDALVALFLAQYHSGILVAEVFWGLWLFPFGLLVIKSGFLPRILGILVLIAGAGWMLQSCSGLISPALGRDLSRLTSLLTAGELPMMLWLLIMGAKDRPIEA